jgi:hypothetical protein
LASAAPVVTVFRAAGKYESPRYQNFSGGVEHQLGTTRISASVLRRRGYHGFMYALSDIPEAIGSTRRFDLTNLRRDSHDSFSVTVYQPFGRDYSWMANYTRSQTLSNAVVDITVDQRWQVGNNLGPVSWDSPHRLLSWGYMPAWSPEWAFAYLLDVRTGFPFSITRDSGEVVGAVNSHRFPTYFELNLHIERKLRVGRYRFAIRAGVNNMTKALNATGVNNILDSPNFLKYHGSPGRHVVFRLRLLKKDE